MAGTTPITKIPTPSSGSERKVVSKTVTLCKAASFSCAHISNVLSHMGSLIPMFHWITQVSTTIKARTKPRVISIGAA